MRPSQGIDKSAEAASVKPGDRVLDVGCGTGVLSREVADRAGSDGRVFGLDVNEDMLALSVPILIGTRVMLANFPSTIPILKPWLASSR